MGENRKGTICLLGAGASADAGYPLASDLLEKFRSSLEQSGDGGAYVAPKSNRQFSQLDVFNRLWSVYEQTLNGTRAYLEDFFAFYDNPYNVGRIFAEDWGTQAGYFERELLRQLPSVALRVAYKELGPHQKTPADYLRPLFALEGPERYASAIATLNFDVTVEHQAHIVSCNLYDGFRKRDLKPPIAWRGQTLHNLLQRWEHVSAIGHDFVGFDDVPTGCHLLLKLHGSIGWYFLEEGADSIGVEERSRHNPVYRFFRIPYRRFWEEELTDDDQILRVGEHGNGTLTRKAGAVWINPHIAFARAYKANPDPLTLELLRTFAKLIDASKTLMTVGYSWSDAHINDLLLGGVARGARLVNIGLQQVPEDILRLWRRKFGTTFEALRRRLFVFGGGAKRCFSSSNVVLPTGKVIDFDLVSALNKGLSADLSLEKTPPNIDLDDPPQPAQLMIRPARK